MTKDSERVSDLARYALAGVRFFNGAAALLAPRKFTRRLLEANPATSPAIAYPLRLFGIRTVILAGELLIPNRQLRTKALDVAVVIHATDTVSAAMTVFRKELPRRRAVAATAISAVNTLLAVLARRGSPSARRSRWWSR
ncbi:MAG: hypothetical protein M3164_00405 [Actinomycetota bacterium]|nr:hypothetical protein [Actinomycetota bacterium]